MKGKKETMLNATTLSFDRLNRFALVKRQWLLTEKTSE